MNDEDIDWIPGYGPDGPYGPIDRLKGTVTINAPAPTSTGNREEYEYVDHPKHYNSHPSGVECIDIVRYHNFNIGSAMKYLWRCGLKPDQDEIREIEKAIWYLQDELKRISS